MTDQQMPARIWADMNMGLWLGGPQPDRRPRPPIEFIRADLAERMAEALEIAAGRFNMMGGVGLVNGVDPKVGYREAMESLSAFRSATQDTEARHD